MMVYQWALAVIALYAVAVVVRIMMGPTIWDRLLGLNMISAKIILSIVLLALILDLPFLLDIALVYSVLGFIGTVLIARFIERSGDL